MNYYFLQNEIKLFNIDFHILAKRDALKISSYPINRTSMLVLSLFFC